MDDVSAPTPAAEEPPPNAYRPGRSPFRSAAQDPLHERVVPVSAQLPGYRPGTARGDLIAGLTVAALAIPSAMAYAEVAGVPPVNGLYALLLPAVLYTFLGSSRQLIVGPEGSISALVGAAILPLAVAGSNEAAELAATLALLVGACFLLAWVVRLGWLADYFSRPGADRVHPRRRGRARLRAARQAARRLHRRATGRWARSSTRSASSARRAATTVLVSALALGALFSAASLSALGCPPRWSSSSARSPSSWALDLAEPRRRRRRRDPRRAAELRDPDAAARRRRRARAGGDRDLPRQLRRRDPHGEDVRREAEPARAGEPGAARVRGVERRRRRHAGLPARSERLAHDGERPDGRDGRRSPGLCAAGAIALVLLFLTEPMSYLPSAVLGAVIVSAAVGLVDLGRVARAAARQPVRVRHRRRHVRRRRRARRAAGARDRGRALDRRRRPAQRAAARRRARLGRPPGPLRERASCTRRRGSRPASWSTGSTTACSSRTRAT